MTIDSIEKFAHKNHWLEVERVLGRIGYILPNGYTVRITFNETTRELIKIIDSGNATLVVNENEQLNEE